MSKLISFSLWGDNPKYLHGAIQNAKQRADYYHDWVCKFFVHKDVPKETVQTLREQEGTIVSILEGDADWTFALTRFLPFADDDVEYFISRDCDSRFSMREVSAVEQWINSGALCHTMKDHPCHVNYPLLAGMTGFRNPAPFDFLSLVKDYENKEYYHYDQDFLRDVILPFYKHSVAYHHKDNFPLPREKDRFVGQAFDEFDKVDPHHLELLTHE